MLNYQMVHTDGITSKRQAPLTWNTASRVFGAPFLQDVQVLGRTVWDVSPFVGPVIEFHTVGKPKMIIRLSPFYGYSSVNQMENPIIS